MRRQRAGFVRYRARGAGSTSGFTQASGASHLVRAELFSAPEGFFKGPSLVTQLHQSSDPLFPRRFRDEYDGHVVPRKGRRDYLSVYREI